MQSKISVYSPGLAGKLDRLIKERNPPMKKERTKDLERRIHLRIQSRARKRRRGW